MVWVDNAGNLRDCADISGTVSALACGRNSDESSPFLAVHYAGDFLKCSNVAGAFRFFQARESACV